MNCPICGSKLELRKDVFGDFVSCSNHINCKYTCPKSEIDEYELNKLEFNSSNKSIISSKKIIFNELTIV